MHKTIIAVCEVKDAGKTTSIRLAYEELEKDASEKRPDQRSRKEVRGAILVIDGVIVGFASAGDRPDYLEKDLVHLIKAGCAVIVCATHTSRSMTYKLVERLASEAQPPFEAVWFQKDHDIDHLSGNRKTAKQIVAAVGKAIVLAEG